jgi:hypothetical protein
LTIQYNLFRFLKITTINYKPQNMTDNDKEYVEYIIEKTVEEDLEYEVIVGLLNYYLCRRHDLFACDRTQIKQISKDALDFVIELTCLRLIASKPLPPQ